MKHPKTALVPVSAPPSSTALARQLETLAEDAHAFLGESSSANTRRAYASDWRSFTAWCALYGLSALPASPETLVLYVSFLAKEGKKTSTIARAKAAISVAHDTAKEVNSTSNNVVKRAMKGIKRTLGTKPNKKRALLADDIRAMLNSAIAPAANPSRSSTPPAPNSSANPARPPAPNPTPRSGAASRKIAIRDAALLALGFAGGFRRSELVAVTLDDIEFSVEGVAVAVRRSKTDQEGRGRWLGIPHKATVALVKAWIAVLAEVGFTDGHLFRAVHKTGKIGRKALTADSVAAIVKRYAKAVGLKPSAYAGHSLRRGFITTTIREGKNERDIMRQTGHRSTAVFRGYVEDAGVFVDNAATDLW